MEHLSQLEPRAYLSSIFENFTPHTDLMDPPILSHDYYGPMVVLDDLDGDGVRDVLMGNSGVGSTGDEPVELHGAAVLSGASGAVLRTHIGGPARFGWSVANLGDTNGDGVSDYAITTSDLNSPNSVYVFSGATGAQLLLIPSSIGRNVVAAAGDYNADGHADLIVGAAGHASVYSGADGAQLRQFTSAFPDDMNFGTEVRGGVDFNGDGHLDFIIASTTAGGDPFWLLPARLQAVSGADGSVLWNRVLAPIVIDTSSASRVPFIISSDLTGDGVPDLALTQQFHILILSGTDGAEAHTLSPINIVLGPSIAQLSDLDGDGVPDLAVSVIDPHGSPGEILGVSSADGTVLAHLRAPADARRGTLDRFTAGDLDGDGRGEIIAINYQYMNGSIPAVSDTYVFDGDALFAPVYTGITSGAASRLIVWGSIADNAVVVRDETMTILTRLPHFAPGEVIIDIFESGTQFIVLGATNAAGANPFLWRADLHLSAASVERIDLGALTLVDAPAGALTDRHAIALAGNVALVQMMLDGVTPTAWLADAEAGTLTYIFTGRPIDVAVATSGAVTTTTVVGAGGTSGLGILWRDGHSGPIGGTPVALDSTGRFLAAIGSGPADEPIPVLIAELGTPQQHAITLPEIQGGSSFVPFGVNRFGEVAGRYINSFQQTSVFLYSLATDETVDAFAERAFGDQLPDDFGALTALGLTDNGDVLLEGEGHAAILTSASSTSLPGPFRVGVVTVIGTPPTTSVALTPDGRVFVVTTDAAGEVLYLARGANDWSRHDLDFENVFRSTFPWPVISWQDPGDDLPHIALGTSNGLLLLTPSADGTTWSVRNLTQEIPGATGIRRSLVTLVPPNNLRLLAGLNENNGLVLYGQTLGTTPGGAQAWAYQNLFATVLYGTHAPLPGYQGDLISYVTGWGAINIAGVSSQGDPVVFWSAPAITGWRITNLSLQAEGDSNAIGRYKNLQVALTPWNGINLYGEDWVSNDIKALWWVPELGDTWSATVIYHAPEVVYPFPYSTLTAYATPWGGLNVARINQAGTIDIYWWSPESNRWTAEVLNDAVAGLSPNFRLVGQLESAVSPSGELDIIARNDIGDMFRFFWTPGAAWQVELV